MTRTAQIGLILIVILGIVTSVAGGALAGGAAGYFFAQQEIAEFENRSQQEVVQTVNSAIEDGELSEGERAIDTEPAEPVLPRPEAQEDTGDAAAAPATNLSELMVTVVQEVSPAVVTVINRNGGALGSGSGVIVSEDGYIISNHHVVEGALSLSVLFADGTRSEAELIGSDPLSDIAVLQVDGAVPGVAPLGDSEALQPGEQVLAIGSPLGNFRNTVTSGVVSAVNRSVAQLEGLIQTDASINRGNSGGPLINLRGEVIGINTLVVRGGGVLGADQAEGLGFAVPSTIVRIVSEQIIQNGEMVYPYLGIRYQMIDGEFATENDIPTQNGAFVADVEAGTPADRAGVETNDVIIAVDGISLAQDNSLRYVLTQYQPGDTVELTIQRGDEEIKVELTLGTRPANLDVIPEQPELP